MTDLQIWKAADAITGGEPRKQTNLSDEQINQIIDTDISGLTPQVGTANTANKVPLEKRLDRIFQRLGPYSGYCDKAAKQVQRQFAKDGIFSEIVRITDVRSTPHIL